MKGLHVMAMTAAAFALPVVAQADAATPQPAGTSGLRLPPPPSQSNNFSWEKGSGFKGSFPGIWVVERQVPVVVERVVEKAPPTVTPPLPPHQGEGEKRKPYVIGATYASLPGGCMKMIDEGVSYYYCGGGEWYKQTGKLYRAVEHKL